MAKATRNTVPKSAVQSILGSTEAIGNFPKKGLKLNTGAKIEKQQAGASFNYYITGSPQARKTTLEKIKSGDYALLPAPGGTGPMTESQITTPMAATGDAPTPP